MNRRPLAVIMACRLVALLVIFGLPLMVGYLTLGELAENAASEPLCDMHHYVCIPTLLLNAGSVLAASLIVAVPLQIPWTIAVCKLASRPLAVLWTPKERLTSYYQDKFTRISYNTVWLSLYGLLIVCAWGLIVTLAHMIFD